MEFKEGIKFKNVEFIDAWDDGRRYEICDITGNSKRIIGFLKKYREEDKWELCHIDVCDGITANIVQDIAAFMKQLEEK